MADLVSATFSPESKLNQIHEWGHYQKSGQGRETTDGGDYSRWPHVCSLRRAQIGLEMAFGLVQASPQPQFEGGTITEDAYTVAIATTIAAREFADRVCMAMGRRFLFWGWRKF